MAKSAASVVSSKALKSQADIQFKSRVSAEDVKKKISMAKRSELIFPPTRVLNMLRKGKYANVIQKGAGIYCAAVMEYLVAEVLELSGNAAKDNNYKRIKPRHITLAVRMDQEIGQLLKNVTISQGGVLPSIHQILLPKKSNSKKSASKNRATYSIDKNVDETVEDGPSDAQIIIET